MTAPRVLDHTAIAALFAAGVGEHVYELWERADRDELTLILPAAALGEASHLLSLGDNQWEALLMAPGVAVANLSQASAVGCAHQPGPLAVRQVVYEATHTRGVIVTRAPWQYPADGPPLRVI